MNLLVTGANGFIGSHLCARLREDRPRARVYALCRKGPAPRGTTLLRGDASDTAGLRAILTRIRFERVFHLAGRPASGDAREMVEEQLLPAAALLQTVWGLPGRRPRIILPGSSAEYGGLKAEELPVRETAVPDPLNAYGAAKLAQTQLARTFSLRGLDIVNARIFNVLGPGLPTSLSIASFVRQVAEAERGLRPRSLAVGDLSAKRDFVSADDAARALILIAERGRSGEIYNVCSGRSVSIESLVRELLSLARVPMRLAQEKSRLRSLDAPDMRGSAAKLRRLGRWRARVSPSESLRAMLAHDRELLNRPHDD